MLFLKPGKMKPNRNTDSLLSHLAPMILVGLAFIGLALILRSSLASDLLIKTQSWFTHPHSVKLLNLKWVNALVFTGTGGFLIGIGVPRMWVSTLAGMIFGVAGGTLLGLAASAVGASLIYAAARLLMADRVTRLSGYRIEHLKVRFQENAFLWVLYFRLFPLSNSTVVSLLAGACRIPFGPYLAGSVIGFTPLALVLSYLGHGSARGNVIHIAVGIISLLGLHIILLMIKRRKIHPVGPLPEPERSNAS